MGIDIAKYREEYKEYCDIFWKSVTSEEAYLEITRGEQDYAEYIKICKNRLFSFKDWLTHSHPAVQMPDFLDSVDDKYW